VWVAAAADPSTCLKWARDSNKRSASSRCSMFYIATSSSNTSTTLHLPCARHQRARDRCGGACGPQGAPSSAPTSVLSVSGGEGWLAEPCRAFRPGAHGGARLRSLGAQPQRPFIVAGGHPSLDGNPQREQRRCAAGPRPSRGAPADARQVFCCSVAPPAARGPTAPPAGATGAHRRRHATPLSPPPPRAGSQADQARRQRDELRGQLARSEVRGAQGEGEGRSSARTPPGAPDGREPLTGGQGDQTLTRPRAAPLMCNSFAARPRSVACRPSCWTARPRGLRNAVCCFGPRPRCGARRKGGVSSASMRRRALLPSRRAYERLTRTDERIPKRAPRMLLHAGGHPQAQAAGGGLAPRRRAPPASRPAGRGAPAGEATLVVFWWCECACRACHACNACHAVWLASKPMQAACSPDAHPLTATRNRWRS
jgi:hypothetical protein